MKHVTLLCKGVFFAFFSIQFLLIEVPLGHTIKTHKSGLFDRQSYNFNFSFMSMIRLITPSVDVFHPGNSLMLLITRVSAFHLSLKFLALEWAKSCSFAVRSKQFIPVLFPPKSFFLIYCLGQGIVIQTRETLSQSYSTVFEYPHLYLW